MTTVDRIHIDIVESKLTDGSTIYAVRVLNEDNGETLHIDTVSERAAINLAQLIKNNLEG